MTYEAPVRVIEPVRISSVGRYADLGMYGTAGGIINTATLVAANRGIFLPIYFDHLVLVNKLWWFNGSNVTGNADVGVYNDAFNLAVSTGATARVNTNRIQEVDVADTFLVPGRYYLALSSSATGNFCALTGGTVIKQRMCGALQQDTVHPLPSTAAPVAIADVTDWFMVGITPTQL